VNVAENDGSIQLCVNITHGIVESSANVRYSTNSLTATGMLYPPLPLIGSINMWETESLQHVCINCFWQLYNYDIGDSYS
jgi:hypothetical protein